MRPHWSAIAKVVAVVTLAGAPKKRTDTCAVPSGGTTAGAKVSMTNAPENIGVENVKGNVPVLVRVIMLVVGVLIETLAKMIFVVESAKPVESRCAETGIVLIPPVALIAFDAKTNAALIEPIRLGLYAVTMPCVAPGLINSGVKGDMVAGETMLKSALVGLTAAPERIRVVSPLF